MSTKTWNLSEQFAKCSFDHWNVKIKPTEPGKGIVAEQTSSEESSPWTIFSVRALPTHGLKTEEAYIREDELIVRFDQSEDDEFAFQLDHRILPLADDASQLSLELWLSIQTDDLDQEPVMTVSCLSATGDFWEILNHGQVIGDGNAPNADATPAALICRTPNSTGLWLIESGDQNNADVLSSPSEQEQRIELFGHFMEKGVIRRARMRFHIIDGELSDESLKAHYMDFLNSPLPLTA